jgi:hypothetical protein
MGNDYKKKIKQAEAAYDKSDFRDAIEKFSELIKDKEFQSCDNITKACIYYNLGLCYVAIAKALSPKYFKEALTQLTSAINNYDLSKECSESNSIKEIDYQILEANLFEIDIYQSVDNADMLTKKIELALKCIQPYKTDSNFKKLLRTIYEHKLDLFCKIADAAMQNLNYDKAITHYEQALLIQLELLPLSDPHFLTQQTRRRGDISFNLAKSYKKS